MDDGVHDTPFTKGWTSPAALSWASCGSALDNVENYMEYSYCDKMFTWASATDDRGIDQFGGGSIGSLAADESLGHWSNG